MMMPASLWALRRTGYPTGLLERVLEVLVASDLQSFVLAGDDVFARSVESGWSGRRDTTVPGLARRLLPGSGSAG